MAAATMKTMATTADVGDFIGNLPDERRQREAEQLDAMMRRVTGHAPAMWGPSIIGYGSYAYRYDSGREGVMCRIGFSPRKAQLVVYLIPGFDEGERQIADQLLRQIGPHSLGKSCLYIKRLDKVDMAALEQLVALCWRIMAERYPQ